VGSPFRGLPSLTPDLLDIFAVRIAAPFPTKIERINTIALRNVGMRYSADNARSPRLEAARTARRHALKGIEQEIAILDSRQTQLWLRRSALEDEASQLRTRLPLLDSGSTARLHLLECVEQEIATVESSQVQLQLQRAALEAEASQLRKRLR
jgi:chromosome segregation ATPase